MYVYVYGFEHICINICLCIGIAHYMYLRRSSHGDAGGGSEHVYHTISIPLYTVVSGMTRRGILFYNNNNNNNQIVHPVRISLTLSPSVLIIYRFQTTSCLPTELL